MLKEHVRHCAVLLLSGVRRGGMTISLLGLLDISNLVNLYQRLVDVYRGRCAPSTNGMNFSMARSSHSIVPSRPYVRLMFLESSDCLRLAN